MDNVYLGKNNSIHGNIASRVWCGSLQFPCVGRDQCRTVRIHESARVDGVIRASEGIVFEREESAELSDDQLMQLDV